MSTHGARLRQLGAALARWQDYWRPVAFHTPMPAWRRREPDLAEAVLSLDDAQVAHLGQHHEALTAWAVAIRPAWRDCLDAARIERLGEAHGFDAGRASWHVPGRKQGQIEAFAEATGAPLAPVLEWCAGKGHLGRHYARRWRVPVLSLDHDAALCAAGRALARQAGIEQSFVVADALDARSAGHSRGRHVVALHACGDLHRALLLGAAGQARAIDLAPCCYDRIAARDYQPYSAGANLPLTRDALHLAVTGTATAGARERRLRDEAMARKLAYLAWYAQHTGAPRPPGMKPVPQAWNRLAHADYATRLAARDGLTPPADVDWTAWAEIGLARQREVMRLDLVRLAFRRALEVWLALDRCAFLEEAGYRVRLAEFCAPSLTPRNLLISARR